MFNASALFSSRRSDWRTPKNLYGALDTLFRFDFDPCPTKPCFDGLSVEWKTCNYVNPPYGRVLPRWTPQNRPFVDTANPAISASRDGVEFYRTAPSDRKVVVTFVRQLRGPHLSTCA